MAAVWTESILGCVFDTTECGGVGGRPVEGRMGVVSTGESVTSRGLRNMVAASFENVLGVHRRSNSSIVSLRG